MDKIKLQNIIKVETTPSRKAKILIVPSPMVNTQPLIIG